MGRTELVVLFKLGFWNDCQKIELTMIRASFTHYLTNSKIQLDQSLEYSLVRARSQIDCRETTIWIKLSYWINQPFLQVLIIKPGSLWSGTILKVFNPTLKWSRKWLNISCSLIIYFTSSNTTRGRSNSFVQPVRSLTIKACGSAYERVAYYYLGTTTTRSAHKIARISSSWLHD